MNLINLYNGEETITEEGVKVSQEIRKFADRFVKKYVKKGYSINDLQRIMEGEVRMACTLAKAHRNLLGVK